VVEGPENGFTSIPVSIYWAITTITTVGFGDITPRTDLGRAVASFMMLLGWGILAVPTGIVTAEMAAERFSQSAARPDGKRCDGCGAGGHGPTAKHCHECGARLPPVS
jgi:voltage-gated potassium channel